MERIRFTEYLDLDLDDETWCCNRCGQTLITAYENYKKGCLVHDRDPREVHLPVVEGEYTFAPDPEWVSILEFYCPECGVQIETEYLPPGHPVTRDIEIDIPKLKSRIIGGEISVQEGRLIAGGE